MKRVVLRHKLREYSDIERDLQRITIRRFFEVIEETKGLKHRGSQLVNILRMYKFEKEDLIRFVKIFNGLYKIPWIREAIDGDEEQAQGL